MHFVRQVRYYVHFVRQVRYYVHFMRQVRFGRNSGATPSGAEADWARSGWVEGGSTLPQFYRWDRAPSQSGPIIFEGSTISSNSLSVT